MPLFFPVSFHPFAVPVLRSFSFKSPSQRTRVFLYTGFRKTRVLSERVHAHAGFEHKNYINK